MGKLRLLGRTVVRGIYALAGLDSPYSAQGYGPNWSRRRRQCLERDEHQCRICGVDQSDLDRELAVHHIQPRVEFNDSDWRAMNDLSNLVSLCHSCHGKFEGKFAHCNHEEFVRKASQKD